MLCWASQYSICCFLDNNAYSSKHHSYEWLVAVGAVTGFSPAED
jgi:para-aminobenzoate synthetase component 1